MITPNYTAWNIGHLPEEEQINRFKDGLFPLLAVCAEGQELMDLMNSTPWLPDFMGHKFETPLEAFTNSPNTMTITLRELVNKYYATVVTVEWQKRMNEEGGVTERSESQGGNQAMSDAEIRETYQILRESVLAANNDPRWKRQLCDAVATFCLQAGIPSVTDNPLDNISSLRSCMLAQASSTREAKLQEEIEALRSRCRRQERIITSLTFRHILETLPGPRPYERGQLLSNAEHWRRFWNRAWGNAQRQPRSGPHHPLDPLIQQFGSTAYGQVAKVGTDLYGTLSANIHHFKGEIGVNADQWDAMAAAILNALAPATAKQADGTIDWEQVDWDAERAKFV